MKPIYIKGCGLLISLLLLGLALTPIIYANDPVSDCLQILEKTDDASNKNQVDMHSFNGLATLRNGNARSYYYMDGSDHQKERKDKDVISRGHQFYGQSNASIYIVKVTSPYDMMIEDVGCRMTISSIGEITTAGSQFMGYFLANNNKTYFSIYRATIVCEVNEIGELRYRHLKIPPFIDFTEDNRRMKTFDGEVCSRSLMNPFDNTFTAGTWYFIFTGLLYDVPQEYISTHTKVWMNFSNNPEDIVVETYEGGEVYGVWFGEYDSNLVISRAYQTEVMCNGKMSFTVNDTFMFFFLPWIEANGFWKIKWLKPEGNTIFRMFVNNGTWLFNPLKLFGSIYGIGGPGKYDLVIRYLDYQPESIQGLPLAMTPYLVALDVDLK